MLSTNQNYTVRFPAQWQAALMSGYWAGLHGESVRQMLESFMRRPGPLPPDPGPGEMQVTMYLPRIGVNVLTSLCDEKSPAAALRRLVAHFIRQGGRTMAPPAPRLLTTAAVSPPLRVLQRAAPPAKKAPVATVPAYQYWVFFGVCAMIAWRLLMARRGSSISGMTPAAAGGSSAAAAAPIAAAAFREWVPRP